MSGIGESPSPPILIKWGYYLEYIPQSTQMATKPTSPSDPKAFTRLTTEPTTYIGIKGIAAPNKI